MRAWQNMVKSWCSRCVVVPGRVNRVASLELSIYKLSKKCIFSGTVDARSPDHKQQLYVRDDPLQKDGACKRTARHLALEILHP